MRETVLVMTSSLTGSSAAALAFLSSPAPSGAAAAGGPCRGGAAGTSRRPDHARPLPTAPLPSRPFHGPAAAPPPEQAALRLTKNSEGQ